MLRFKIARKWAQFCPKEKQVQNCWIIRPLKIFFKTIGDQNFIRHIRWIYFMMFCTWRQTRLYKVLFHMYLQCSLRLSALKYDNLFQQKTRWWLRRVNKGECHNFLLFVNFLWNIWKKRRLHVVLSCKYQKEDVSMLRVSLLILKKGIIRTLKFPTSG